jgi:hypothetical protein
MSSSLKAVHQRNSDAEAVQARVELGGKGIFCLWQQLSLLYQIRGEVSADLPPSQNYLVADEPGSTITFGFSTKLGMVQMHSLRSATFGLGTVYCWVDDERDKGVKLDGYWDLPFNIGR